MRYARTAAFIVLLKVVIGILLLTPLLANAKGPFSAGTYEGVAQGGSSGQSSAVTVWVEANDDTLHYTFYVARFDASFSAEGAKQTDDGSGTVPLTVSSAGVNGSGQITLTPDGETWAMTGAGSGSGFGYEGDASLTATRVSAGIVLPSVGDQVADMFSSLTGGSLGDGGTPSSADATEHVEGVFLESLSPHFSPAQAGPPIVETRKLASTGLGLLVLIAAIILA